MEIKVAYPKETQSLLKKIAKEPMAMDEINKLPNARILLDEIMKNGLVKRILVPINGIDYIYLEAVPTNATFKQGRRNFSRSKI